MLNPSAERRSKLLIIEDTLIHSTLIARIADKIGFTTVIAGCYEDARNLLHTGNSTASRSTSGSASTSEPKCSITFRKIRMQDADHHHQRLREVPFATKRCGSDDRST